MDAVISTKCPVLNEAKTKEFGITTNLEVLVLFEKDDNWSVPSVPKKVFGCPAYDRKKCAYQITCTYFQG